MKHLKFLMIVGATAAAMVAAWKLLFMLLVAIATLLDVDYQLAVGGGYTMEVVASAFAFVMVLWRLGWAALSVKGSHEVWALMRTRPASFALFMGGLIAMGFANRFFWWLKHIFTEEAYVHTEYNGAVNAVCVSLLLCGIVHFLNGKEEKPLGIPSSYIVFVASAIGFIAGLFMYNAWNPA